MIVFYMISFAVVVMPATRMPQPRPSDRLLQIQSFSSRSSLKSYSAGVFFLNLIWYVDRDLFTATENDHEEVPDHRTLNLLGRYSRRKVHISGGGLASRLFHYSIL